SAPSARSASATASAGTTCPAVPPAPITTFGALTRGDLDRELVAVERAQAPGSRSRDVQQPADAGEHHTQIRRRVGDERQRDARQRRETQHDEYVQSALAKNQRRQ